MDPLQLPSPISPLSHPPDLISLSRRSISERDARLSRSEGLETRALMTEAQVSHLTTQVTGSGGR